jgi:hypothetical protein
LDSLRSPFFVLLSFAQTRNEGLTGLDPVVDGVLDHRATHGVAAAAAAEAGLGKAAANLAEKRHLHGREDQQRW